MNKECDKHYCWHIWFMPDKKRQLDFACKNDCFNENVMRNFCQKRGHEYVPVSQTFFVFGFFPKIFRDFAKLFYFCRLIKIFSYFYKKVSPKRCDLYAV